MDSVNLSEAQNTPLNCRNTASNTSPIACACCGAKDYIQNIPQAFCYPALHPGIPSLPVIHPLFHNAAIPTNFICNHNHSDNTTLNEERKKATNESDKISRSANHYTFSQKGKNDFRDHTALNEQTQKKNYLGPELQHSGHSFCIANSAESQYNSVMQRCACGDHTPWTCSPVITPMISYCLFWNSQKSNISIFPSNCNTCPTESSRQKNKEYPANQEYSSANTDNKKYPKSLNVFKDPNNSTEITRCLHEDAYHDSENNEQNSENSLASLSFNSVNFNEKSSFKDNEKEGKTNFYSKNGSLCAEEEEEDTELETLDCIDQVESEDCLKLEENSNKNDECQSPLDSSSYSDLRVFSEKKLMKNNVDSSNVYSETQANPSDISAGENVFLYLQDRANDITKNEEYSSEAAMGDLGGTHCNGYKVNISLYEGNLHNENCLETENEETLATKELLLKGLLELEENITDSLSEKNLNESIKSGKSHKSGIAKLSNTSRSRESKADFKKNLRHSKESNQREPSVTKRKHNCFTTDNPMGNNDNSLKIQKSRNCTAQQPTVNSGSEKQQKELNCKGQPAKKEEKISTTKVRTVESAQKNVKSNCKK